MEKKQVKWTVNLYRYNLSKTKDFHPRVVQLGRKTTDALAAEIEQRTGIYRYESVKAILSIAADIVKEYLIEGYAVAGKLGTLQPAVTGMWSFERDEPSQRAKNQAVVRYSMSRQMKESLANPVFRATIPRKINPTINTIQNFDAEDEGREEWQPKDEVIIRGDFLLMNGEATERGLYFVDADTGKVALHMAPESFRKNTRTEIRIRVPALAAGYYRLRVVSQCTTSPRPRQQPKTGETRRAWTIGEAQTGL